MHHMLRLAGLVVVSLAIGCQPAGSPDEDEADTEDTSTAMDDGQPLAAGTYRVTSTNFDSDCDDDSLGTFTLDVSWSGDRLILGYADSADVLESDEDEDDPWWLVVHKEADPITDDCDLGWWLVRSVDPVARDSFNMYDMWGTETEGACSTVTAFECFGTEEFVGVKL